MRSICRMLVALLMLAIPLLGRGQPATPPPANASSFVLFIHAGGPGDPDQDLIKKIAVALAARGYNVHSPDNERDKIGGPGVDYFSDTDLPAAQDIATVISPMLPQGSKPLVPRRQRGKSEPGYIGIWLFG
jgi:hypothetical protein